jgi:hypothetical protein
MIEIKKRELVRVPMTVKIFDNQFDIDVNPYSDIKHLSGYSEVQARNKHLQNMKSVEKLKGKIPFEKYNNFQQISEELLSELEVETFEKHEIPLDRFVERFNGEKVFDLHLKELVKADDGFWLLIDELDSGQKVDLISQLRTEALKEIEGK